MDDDDDDDDINRRNRPNEAQARIAMLARTCFVYPSIYTDLSVGLYGTGSCS